LAHNVEIDVQGWVNIVNMKNVKAHVVVNGILRSEGSRM